MSHDWFTCPICNTHYHESVGHTCSKDAHEFMMESMQRHSDATIDSLMSQVDEVCGQVNTLVARLKEAEEILSHAFQNPTYFESVALNLEAEQYFRKWGRYEKT